MSLTLEQVEHIANLARLDLTSEEKERYCQQLSAILTYFEQLQSVDTTDIPPTSGVQPDRSALRSDQARPSLDVDTLMCNAPDSEDDQFRVPPVFE
jgi:aspartyl-tRNA(Asn)/glutamyl-tRNA(Gln) amidotransferase subunit C